MTDEFPVEFSDTSILDSMSGYVDSLVKEAIETYLTKNNNETLPPVTIMLMYVKAGQSRERTLHHPPSLLSNHQLRHKGSVRYTTTRTELAGSQFPENEDRDSPGNVSLFAIQPLDAAASLRIFYR
jgi:hypothetical protein